VRILTVRQPWAWAIIHGVKGVENRVRNIAGDYRGLVAIHAGLRFDYAALYEDRRIHDAISPDTMINDLYVVGNIIGFVNLWAVHKHDGSRRFLCCPNSPDRYTRWAEPNVWHLCLGAPYKLPVPIPFKGALGLRELDPELAARIEREAVPA
jgi:hypothetical protein